MSDQPFAWVYILASQKSGTLYVGVTTRLIERIAEHREGRAAGFTKRYKVDRLVHLEPFGDINDAIAREKGLKKWRRAWKVELIEKGNPDWRDLWYDLNR
ncbi:GIY-YIG nuclease family protein [Erythrobacter sp. YT30]|uniref:GIY-YIG nuclease family protein n=1 Tax=Erythrobacter sp. YT30 TaxID=1735012 RepID=UPI001F1630BF|nr:GIY-YIG nuclease family protein [Erythrobacter sp. YT30]